MAAKKTNKPVVKVAEAVQKATAAKTEAAKTEAAKTEAVKAEPVKTEAVKAESVKAEPVKTEAVKAEGKEKKAAEKKAAEKKTSAEKTTAKKAMVSELYVQFAGKSYSQEDLMKIAKDVWKYDLKQEAAELKQVELYVKPEESMVYYVMNKEFTGSFYI